MKVLKTVQVQTITTIIPVPADEQDEFVTGPYTEEMLDVLREETDTRMKMAVDLVKGSEAGKAFLDFSITSECSGEVVEI